MSFKDLAKKRFSVRSFSEKEVEEEKIAALLEIARTAPTAANRQPVRIAVIKDADKLSECTKYTFHAPLLLVVCYDREKSWKRRYDGHDAGEIDASIAATHIMLEAADLGLGTTWVGYFDPALVKEKLCLPDNLVPVALLPLGYPAEGLQPIAQHTDRKDVTELLIDLPEELSASRR